MERRSAEEWFDDFEEIFVGRYEIDKTKSPFQNDLCDVPNDNTLLGGSACPLVKKGGRKIFSCTI